MIDPTATGRRLGGYKSAAFKTGLSVHQWIAKYLNGEAWCYRCRTWKNQQGFTTDRSRPSGFASICRPCMSLASTASRYGLTRDQLTTLKTLNCAICNGDGPIVIDHCHKSGDVRKPLCQRCNNGLGMFLDDPKLLQNAIQYLDDHDG